LKEARTNLTKTTIYAPQSGTVSKLNVELGERVVGTSQMAGTELLRIANLNKMEVRVNVNENDITRVSMNDTVIIDVDSYSASGRKFKGVVYEIASSANGLGGTSAAAAVSTDAVTEFEVKIRVLRQSYSDLIIGKRSYPLKPGMTASVEIITDRKNGVLSVPLASVTTRDPSLKTDGGDKKEGEEDNNQEPEKVIKKDKIKEVVFVVDKDNKAKLREVKTGISDFENIEILSGLKDGETIISGPYITVSKKLKEGEIVAKKKEEEKKKK
jgi:HlyD family secretion protein